MIPTDALDTVLHTLAPRGAVAGRRTYAGTSWRADVAAGAVSFHAVLDGNCEITAVTATGNGGAPVRLGAGDLAVLPHGHAAQLRGIAGSADDTAATLVSGELAFGGVSEADGPHPLLAVLPPILVVRADAPDAARCPTGERAPWLAHTLAFLACESSSRRLGAGTVMGHLASVLFIVAVRAHLSEAAVVPGWLRAFTDPATAPALAAVQARPDAPWTVDALAREAGLSRSAFSARFREVAGVAPMQFVTAWRMREAARLMRAAPRAALADVAGRVGYESEAAFNRTFKRHLRRTPGAYRRSAAA